jgi:hypothetical protein
VVVGAGPGEADQLRTGPVPVGEALHLGQHVGLAQPVGHVEPGGQPQRGRDGVEQLLEG